MEPSVRSMPRGHVVSMRGTPDGCRIICRSGILWVTRENDTGEYVIVRDETFISMGSGLIVIEAVVDSTLQVSPIMQGEEHDHPAERGTVRPGMDRGMELS